MKIGCVTQAICIIIKQNFTETEMLIHLPSGSHAPQTEDLLDVRVRVTTNSSTDAPSAIELIQYLRVSSYGVYDECRDDGIDRDLCVCSPSHPSTRQWHQRHPVVFGTPTVILSLNSHVFIYERRSSDGIIIEASCDDNVTSSYKLKLSTHTKLNVVSSKQSPLMVVIQSGMKVFLDVFYSLDSSKEWELKYEVSFMQLS